MARPSNLPPGVTVAEYEDAMRNQPDGKPRARSKKPKPLKDSNIVADFRAASIRMFSAPKLGDADRHWLTGVGYGIKLSANLGPTRAARTYVALNQGLTGFAPGVKPSDVIDRATKHTRKKKPTSST